MKVTQYKSDYSIKRLIKCRVSFCVIPELALYVDNVWDVRNWQGNVLHFWTHCSLSTLNVIRLASLTNVDSFISLWVIICKARVDQLFKDSLFFLNESAHPQKSYSILEIWCRVENRKRLQVSLQSLVSITVYISRFLQSQVGSPWAVNVNHSFFSCFLSFPWCCFSFYVDLLFYEHVTRCARMGFEETEKMSRELQRRRHRKLFETLQTKPLSYKFHISTRRWKTRELFV